ncbi:MAG: pyridoxal phosphate-dependent aminotransferase family protein [Bacteroidales bacterium]|nr:pyridoxal phosphate-dependent aminotransferase family protein [Bacteroidales bacterium]
MNLLRKRTSQYTVPQQVKKSGIYPYFKAIESNQDTEVIINGRKIIMFGSNSYLGLTNHPKVIKAAQKAIDKYGTGCAGSPFLNGRLDIHKELEQKLAEFVNKDEAIIFSTGFQVNLGVISSLTNRSDYILLDNLDHASIIEGSRLSFSKVLKYDHNNMESLESKLILCEPNVIKLIVVDGIFSMDGDIVKLPEIVKLAKKYKATIMVDDAHAFGVLGKNGNGTAAHFGLTNEVDLIMGTFSKSFASIGGFIASDFDTINYLRHNARSLIFSASISPASTAAVLASLEIMKNEPERIHNLWEITNYALKGFNDLGFNTGRAETPIIPIYIGNEFKTLKLTQLLFEEGIFVNPIVSPAVSKDQCMIRFSLMATHTKQQVDFAFKKFYQCANMLEIVPKLEIENLESYINLYDTKSYFNYGRILRYWKSMR